MKPLLTLSILFFCFNLHSQDLALLNVKHTYSPPAPDYFHKTMAMTNEPDFKKAGKLLKDGGFMLIAGTMLGVLGSGFAYLAREDKPEVVKGVLIGSGAVFVVFTVIGGAKISRAGEVLREY